MLEASFKATSSFVFRVLVCRALIWGVCLLFTFYDLLRFYSLNMLRLEIIYGDVLC